MGSEYYSRRGFTLAELLLALVILGVIATFTIPKVLQAQQDSKFNSVAKEAAGMIAQTHQLLQAQGRLSGNTTREDFTPYFNYVRVLTTGFVDDDQTQTTKDCSSYKCFLLHNGAVIHFAATNSSFNGTAATNGNHFRIDPDGKVTDGTTNGPGKSVSLWIYYNGKMRTTGTIDTNSCNSTACSNPDSTLDPPWFSWN